MFIYLLSFVLRHPPSIHCHTELVTPLVIENSQLTGHISVGAQKAVSFSVLDNGNYIWHSTYKRLHCLCQHKKKTKFFESRRFFVSLNAGRTRLILRSCLDVMLLPQFYYYTNLSPECADSVSGQLHGNEKRPVIGVTHSGRVWRKVPKSNAWNVTWFSLSPPSPLPPSVLPSTLGVFMKTLVVLQTEIR